MVIAWVRHNSRTIYNIELNAMIRFLTKINYFDKINWRKLSENPNALDLLGKNLDKINWTGLALNPNAIDFTYLGILF